MIISTKGRYGLRAMFVLALQQHEGPVSIKYIAEDQAISETYLEQLFSKLRKSGLVRSVRGAQGGYQLEKPPKDISVGDILKALEGPLAPSDCVVGDGAGICQNSEMCSTRSIWKRIYEGVNAVVDGISLQDMLDDFFSSEHSKTPVDPKRCK